jgi:hypothetical protein
VQEPELQQDKEQANHDRTGGIEKILSLLPEAPAA